MPDFERLVSNRHRKEILDMVSSSALSAAMIKAFAIPGVTDPDERYGAPKIKDETDWQRDEAFRRAIHSVSNYYNSLGMPRSNFTKSDNDDLAENAYYSVCEKSIMDYLSSMNWTVEDKKGKEIDEAIEFLDQPNPQQDFSDIIKITVRDILRYDAGTIIKTYNMGGNLVEFKPYLGTEFWPEIDRLYYKGMTAGMPVKGWYSRGYIMRWWQRSRTGLYISFMPDEVAYMRMYPRSDDVYGTDFITRLKYQIQYLIDSTRAAGKTFANGVVPSLVWSHPQIFDWNQLNQRRMEIKKENTGSYKFGNVLHLIKDEEVETLSHTLHDMEWLEGQRFISQMVWAMFGFQPEEFSGQSVNRATAYISRNVTKSKMLYPLMHYYERIINKEILPKVKGYNKDWSFKFSMELDLDDELKQAQILATKVQSANMLASMGVDAKDALKVSNVLDDPTTIKIENPPINISQPMKQPAAAKNKFGSVEGSQNKEIRSPRFGDKEERQAGINKANKKSKSKGVFK